MAWITTGWPATTLIFIRLWSKWFEILLLPLLQYIIDMISKTKISNIVNRIAENYDPEKIILFGSYATGTANDDSDLDFIIVKKN